MLVVLPENGSYHYPEKCSIQTMHYLNQLLMAQLHSLIPDPILTLIILNSSSLLEESLERPFMMDTCLTVTSQDLSTNICSVGDFSSLIYF